VGTREIIMNEKHGLRNHPLYVVWKDIKTRCYNPNNIAYKNYGGRGIKVSEEWLNNPERFIKEAIEDGWVLGLEIDRIDNNGNYERKNCHWVTRKRNTRNRRNNRLITINSKTKTLAEWAEIIGISPVALSGRIKRGWETTHLLNPSQKKQSCLAGKNIKE
jgi:hypothetical protein